MPHSIIDDIANFMVVEIYGDNGMDIKDYYDDPGKEPVRAFLRKAVAKNMPVIAHLSEDDLQILTFGDMEQQVDRKDVRSPEEVDQIRQADRQLVLIKMLPDWPMLNLALEYVFEGQIFNE